MHKIIQYIFGNFFDSLSDKDKVEMVQEVDIQLNIIKIKMKNQETNTEALLRVAKEMVGRDASPRDQAPDDLGCAESLANVIHSVDPDFPITIVSTAKLFRYLQSSPKYEATNDLGAGHILISPTGWGKRSAVIPNGHCGIFDENNDIYSNNSYTGLWDKHFTLDQWITRYRINGGYPLFVFKLK